MFPRDLGRVMRDRAFSGFREIPAIARETARVHDDRRKRSGLRKPRIISIACEVVIDDDRKSGENVIYVECWTHSTSSALAECSAA